MADWTAAATLWTGVAAFVVSAATLGLVIRAEVRALRLGPAVFLRLEPFGTATANGDEVHVWELINGGGENASIVCLRLVGCETVATAEYPVFKVVPAGDSRRLLVRSEDISCAWAVIGWTHVRDGRWATFQWFAPEPGAALAAERDEQTRRIRGRWSKWRLWKLWRRVRPVGPGGVRLTRMRTGLRTRDEDLDTALSLTEPVTADAGAGNSPPRSTLSQDPGGP